MIVNTRRLFLRLLPVLKIDTVFDVGSMDGADALKFRTAAPAARIYAFEANPENFCLMQADSKLRENAIVPLPLAVTDYDGEADFFITPAGYSPANAWRGMSSLNKRLTLPQMLRTVRVNTTRLDTFMEANCPAGARLALWIDTEGKAYEAIRGCAAALQQVHLLHVEVETAVCIGEDQRFYPDVKALLHTAGFLELATDGPCTKTQFNALFVRSGLAAPIRHKLLLWLAVARARYLLVRILYRICPACLRRYSAWRLYAAGRR